MATGDTIDIVAVSGSAVGLQVDASGYALLPTATQASIDAIELDTSTTIPALLPAALVGGKIDANVGAISADTVAADNLEAQFDGTGYTDDTAPATQAQLDGIANVGSAVNRPATSYVLTTGVQSVGTYTATEALDASYHTHTDTAGAIDYYYEFLIGGGTPSSALVTGYLTGANDDVDVYGYDWVSASWKQVGNISGSSSTSNSFYSFDLFVNMVGTGANRGIVRVRFYKASGLSTATMAVDQIFVSYSQAVEGYDRSSVWFDSNASNTGTVVGVDGTASNPVSTEAAVQTLLTNTNYNGLVLRPGSTYTAAAAHDNLLINQHGAVLALGGQSFNDTHVFEGQVSGIATAATGEMEFHGCEVGTVSVQTAHFDECTFSGTATFTLAADYHITNCQSGVAGSGSPTFTKTAGQTITAEFRKWSGGITISGLESGDVLSVEGMFGTITLNGADAQVEIRGSYKALTNNLTGSPTVNLDGAWKGADIASILVDTGTTLPATLAALNDIAVADILTTQMTESYAADGAAPTLAQALMLIQQQLGDFAISGTTMTVKKVDGSTTAATFTLDSSSSPTSITRTT